jgi:hypothetical protein
MISAIKNRGQLNFMVFKGWFIAKVFLEFLNHLVRQSKRNVFFIVDRHPVHRSRKVKQWLEKHGYKGGSFWVRKFRFFSLRSHSK